MKINWKQKLTSRKFWCALIGFVTPLLLAFGVSESVVAEVAGIISACSTLIIYIYTEGSIDAANASAGTSDEQDGGVDDV